MKFKVILFFILAISAAGCVDIPNFDDTPKIYYNGIDNYTVFNDSTGKKVREVIIVTIDFEDGDGDLGASSEERNDSVNFLPKYGTWGNYELVTSRKENGKWVDRILGVDQYKWLPLLKPDGKPGPIKGKLDLNFNQLYGDQAKMYYYKFKVRIRDRALRVSNQITTDSIYVPGYD